MIGTRPAKGHYSETEAAEALGISVENLRALVRRHVADSDEDVSNLAIAHFQPSDLLLLRILSGQGFYAHPQKRERQDRVVQGDTVLT